MSYIKAADVLPEELISKVQSYIDGEYVYIPRKKCNRKVWGEATKSKEITAFRNSEIFEKYMAGISAASLSEGYCLSLKSIQKIIAEIKSGKHSR
jgi:Mor family transcriptional regulator